MNEQRNLILAIVLSAIVVFGWQYLVGVPAMKQEQARQAQVTAQQKSEVASLPGGAAAAGKTLPRAEALAQASERISIATPTLDGSINLTGGRFDDLKLRTYRETPNPKSPEIELLSPQASEHPYFAEFGWIAPKGSTAPTPGATTQWTKSDGATLSPGHDVTLTYDNGQGQIFTRRIAIDQQYMFTITDTVENSAANPVELYPYGLVSRHNIPTAVRTWVVHEGFIGALGGSLKDPTYAALAEKNDTQHFDSQGGWLGITDKYWMAAAIPPQSIKFTATYKAYDLNGTKAYQADYLSDPVTIAPNSSQLIVHHLFAGAKQVKLMDAYRDQLGIKLFDYSVDWGWFWFFTRPIFLALDFVKTYVGGNFGIAILLLTVFVKALFFPLANTSYRAMSKMKKLQPEMERLKATFKDDKAAQQQEVMKLYQKEKVNPMAGCLPMLIQVPVFFSLYKVLIVTIDMRQAPFYGIPWIKDLSAPDPTNLFTLFGLIPWDPTVLPVIGHFLVLGIFPLIMGATMWLQTNLNPPPADPTQAKIFGFMPLIFMFMMANFAVGLVIYWSWNNILSITQQVIIMKRTGTPIDFFDRLHGMWKRIKRGEPPEKPAGPPD